MAADRGRLKSIRSFLAFCENKRLYEADPDMKNRYFGFSGRVRMIKDKLCGTFTDRSGFDRDFQFNLPLDDEDFEYLEKRYSIIAKELQCEVDKEDLEDYKKQRDALNEKIDSIKLCE